MRHGRLGHIPKLVLDIVNPEPKFLSLLQLLNDRPEKQVNLESVNSSLIVHVQNSPEVLKGLGGFLVFHCQNKIKESLVIHFTFEGLVFFKDPINENPGQTRRVPG